VTAREEVAEKPAETTPFGGALAEALYSQSLDCVHCGLCLSSCPTYRVTGRETASPRGRIYLMRGLAEGRLEEADVLEEEAFLCLGCRACETACPSGVRYGEMLEHARAVVRETGKSADWATWLERFLLREIVPHRRRLGALVSLLAFVQRTGIDRLAARLMPSRLRGMHALLPGIPPRRERNRLPARTPAEGERRGRVLLFEGCVMPELFGRVNEAARLLLSRAGFEVIVPAAQGCCGALQAHSGDLGTARSLARRNVAVFDRELDSVDALLVTSAGCSAALRETDHWIGESGRSMKQATRDVLEFLAEVDPKIDFKPIAKRVCYDDPCHLIHAQGVAAAPRRLLRSIPELELVAHRDPEACCGAAGIYNLTQPEMSARVLAPKLDALIEAAPEIVATANPGCAMQLAAGLAGRGVAARVVHPIELLEQASRGASRSRESLAGRPFSPIEVQR
jgi:glycolate oxidase iron-sulfur subunit